MEALVSHLARHITPLSTKANYTHLVECLLRDLVAPLSLDDTRKVSGILTAQINEKQKAFSNKKKKSKKVQLKGGTDVDLSRFGEEEERDLYAGEYDDFM